MLVSLLLCLSWVTQLVGFFFMGLAAAWYVMLGCIQHKVQPTKVWGSMSLSSAQHLSIVLTGARPVS